ncbi:MAG: protein involved in biosynthesis of mitomycin antibiotics/polyketide fumonisin [Schlesneria sp.]|nr:protein involved in biosynthesis of mitomycin antibiotics/polyketide fumonisin [Schlesneria sp.]
MTDLAAALNRDGYVVARGGVPTMLVADLQNLCLQSPERSQAKRQGKSLYGVRQLLSAVPALREIVDRPPFTGLSHIVMAESARAVKGVFFDKTPSANWMVPWHQDVTINVTERREVTGFEMRPVQDGIVHALPPVSLSENLLTLRIHLDDAGADHGALRVIPRSHLAGRLEPAEIRKWIERVPEVAVSVQAGDVMLMRPLLLHASSPCQSPAHRRVVHVEYAADDLPGGLRWAG